MIAFIAAAILATLLAAGLIVVPLYRGRGSGAPLAALLTALLFPLVVAVLYGLISSYPWLSPPSAASAAVPSSADSAEISALRQQLDGSAQDAGTWSRIGAAYMAEERYADASDAFRQALQSGGDASNDEARLAYAEASILADRQSMVGEAGQLIDEVVQRQPGNPKALWYGGMVALARGDIPVARERWRKLLDLSPPPQVRQILEQQLAQLDAPPPSATANAGGAGTNTLRIAVQVRVKPELASRIRPGAVLFLFARTPGGGGPPLAVIRRQAVKLPLAVEISDADSMVPGQSISGKPEIQLTARMANDGEARAAPGDVYGEVRWRPETGTGRPLEIVMDQVVE